MGAIELLNIEGCIVLDCETGLPLAVLHEAGDSILVERKPACTLGVYLLILIYLEEYGFDVI